MPHKLKFHLIAVGLIIVTISVLHSVFKPQASAPRIVHVVQYTPTITGATWGMNCNSRIEQTLAASPQRFAARPVMPTESEDSAAKAPLALVNANNVLNKVQTLCLDKEICNFRADNATLGELLPSCPNELKIQFYCSELERVRTVTFRQGQEVKLDCSGTRR